jgi:hypothetical protein
MADKNSFSLFGFKIRRKSEEEVDNKTFVQPPDDDGSLTISSSAFFGSASIDVEGVAKNEIELITRYREMSMQPEIEAAIEDVVNEAIVNDDDGKSIKLVTDDLKQSDKIKKAIYDEFDNVQRLLNYSNMSSDIFRRYYVDGRLFYQIIIDVNNPQKGILELRYIDPRRIKKVRQIKKVKDPQTGVDLIDKVEEYYVYNDKVTQSLTTLGVKIATDSIIYVTSGLMDPRRSMVLSYLHKAIKPLNQLRMIEDASVIYKISRAPQRRVFYIDVGNLPKQKAEQYVRDIMTKYKNKLVYDANTGEVRDDRRHLSMLEDFWLPRRSDGGKGTDITTLQSTDNFNDMAMVEYFQQKLYKSLNVPVTRLDPGQAVSIGRSMEITRDELKFSKFVDKLRKKFSDIFYQAMRVQLVLKGICTEEEWEQFKQDIYFDFTVDNNFVELKESELMTERLNILATVDPFVGKYYSKKWIRENILRLNEEEMKLMDEEIAEERITDFTQQSEDQEKQITLQAQAAELTNKLMPQPDQQIDAGAEQEQSQQPQQSTSRNNNPYNIQQ